MDAALDTIRNLAPTTEAGRRELMNTLHQLAYSMEDTNDTLLRYGLLNLQGAAVKVGQELGVFALLAEARSPLHTRDIAQRTTADVTLLERVLRYLAAAGAIRESGRSQYTANQVTKNLSQKLAEAGMSHYFDTVSPMLQVLPSYLKKNGYQNPQDELHVPFQEAWSTSLPVFEWFASNPTHMSCFNNYMALRREPETTWLTVYPVEAEAKGWDASQTVLVNIGGGVGHQCAQFKQQYPNLPGRVILQDLSFAIEQALPTAGVENMAHNFFEPQPVYGAKFYYLRAILHDHPPSKVRAILENLKLAMTKQSILLVDEMVIPETGVNLDAASIDMTMLSACAGGERNLTQWRDMFHDAGLELTETYPYNPATYESVMDVRLPDATDAQTTPVGSTNGN